MAQRHCDVCNGWHDLEEPWPQACMGHYHKRKNEERSGIQIMKDIDPYKSAVTGEVIGGRRQHRDHLRARGLVEIGNEKVQRKPLESPGGIGNDIVRAANELGHWRH